MLKKFIALASLTALCGLGTTMMVAGCTTEEVTDEDDGGSDKTDSGTKPRGDGSVSDEDAGPAICPSPAPTDDPPYKNAAPAQTTCEANIGDVIDAYIKGNAQATFKDLETYIAGNTSVGGQPCSDCIFTTENDSAWGPIVYAGDGSSGGAFFNYGSCFERGPGGSAACGKAVQSAEICIDSVCSDEDCGSDNAKQACISSTLQDTATGCGRYDVQGDCGAGLQTLNTACGTGLDVIKVMCAKKANDGG